MAESNKDHKPALTESQRRKNELIAELARSRSGMTLHAGQVKYQSDVGRRVTSSVRHHVGAWMAGALVTGGAISLLPRREKKVYVNPISKEGKKKLAEQEIKKGGFWAALLGILVPIFKPIITRLITRQLSSYLGGPKDDSGKAEDTPDVAAASI